MLKVRLSDRLTRAYLAHAINIAVLVLTQVAMVPLFLHTIGQTTYEKWVVMLAIVGLTPLLDLGLFFHFSAKVRMEAAAGMRNVAVRSIGVALFSYCILLALLGIGIALLGLAVSQRWLSNYPIPLVTQDVTLFVLVIAAILGLPRSFIASLFSAHGEPEVEVFLFSVLATGQAVLVGIGLVFGCGLFGLALLYAAGTLVFGYGATLVEFRRRHPDILLSPCRPTMLEVREVVEAARWNVLPVAVQSLVLHGPVIVLGYVAGGQVLVFTLSRTVTGLVRQFYQQIARVAATEMSRLGASGGAKAQLSILRKGSLMTTSVAALGLCGIMSFSESIFLVWTREATLEDPKVLWAFAVFALLLAPIQVAMFAPQHDGQARRLASPMLYQIVVTGLLLLALVPWWGAFGAALAVGISETVTAGAYALFQTTRNLGAGRIRFFVQLSILGALLGSLSYCTGSILEQFISSNNLAGFFTLGIFWGVITAGLLYYSNKLGEKYLPPITYCSVTNNDNL
jgi:O-antigen/teichoic acid export membrane protein